MHADLMFLKRSVGRSNGQPEEASDCSGKAGMVVVVVDGGGRNDWSVGFGFDDVVKGVRREKKKMKNNGSQFIEKD